MYMNPHVMQLLTYPFYGQRGAQSLSPDRCPNSGGHCICGQMRAAGMDAFGITIGFTLIGDSHI